MFPSILVAKPPKTEILGPE